MHIQDVGTDASMLQNRESLKCLRIDGAPPLASQYRYAGVGVCIVSKLFPR